MKLRQHLAPYLWDTAHDPWGSAMIVTGAICDVLYVLQGKIATGLEYRPAAGLQGRVDLVHDPVSGENDLQAELLELVDQDLIKVADLEYAARIFDRYLDLVRLAGKDY